MDMPTGISAMAAMNVETLESRQFLSAVGEMEREDPGASQEEVSPNEIHAAENVEVKSDDERESRVEAEDQSQIEDRHGDGTKDASAPVGERVEPEDEKEPGGVGAGEGQSSHEDDSSHDTESVPQDSKASRAPAGAGRASRSSTSREDAAEPALDAPTAAEPDSAGEVPAPAMLMAVPASVAEASIAAGRQLPEVIKNQGSPAAFSTQPVRTANQTELGVGSGDVLSGIVAVLQQTFSAQIILPQLVRVVAPTAGLAAGTAGASSPAVLLADAASAAALAVPGLMQFNAMTAFADAMAEFAHESAALSTVLAVVGDHRRAWAVTAGTLIVDAILIGQWQTRRRRNARRNRVGAEGSLFSLLRIESGRVGWPCR